MMQCVSPSIHLAFQCTLADAAVALAMLVVLTIHVVLSVTHRRPDPTRIVCHSARSLMHHITPYETIISTG